MDVVANGVRVHGWFEGELVAVAEIWGVLFGVWKEFFTVKTLRHKEFFIRQGAKEEFQEITCEGEMNSTIKLSYFLRNVCSMNGQTQ